MIRHLILPLGLALVAAATALLLADVGVFDGLARWLFARYEGEALWKAPAVPAWRWLPLVVAGAGALLVGWVAVDVSTVAAKCAVLAAALGAIGFLSLTLAFYGVAYDPWSALTATLLAFAMGWLLSETPASRDRRASQVMLGGRASSETVAAWESQALAPPWRQPGAREGAVLAVRILSPAPPCESVGAHLAMRSQSLGEMARLLRARPGVVLDVPAGDSVRAFFGFRPEAVSGDLDSAAQAALALATFLREEAHLQAQADQPSAAWGIGLSVGPLVTGMHGPEPETFWTASGSPAEQARQLAALNARHHTSILVGRRAAEALSARFDLRPVEGDAIHTLLAAKAPPPPEEVPLADVLADPDLPTATPPRP